MAIVLDNTTIGNTYATISASTTHNFTTNVTIASGSFITLVIGFFNASVTLSSVSGGSLSWTIDAQGAAGSPSAPKIGIVSAQAPSGLASGTTLTATFSASPDAVTINGSSWSGVETSSPVDATGSVVGVSPAAQAWTTNNITILAGSVIVAGNFNETNNSTNTITSPSQELYEVNASEGYAVVAAYRIESSAGAYSVAGSWGTAAQSTSRGVAYKAAAGSPPVTDGPKLIVVRSNLRLA